MQSDIKYLQTNGTQGRHNSEDYKIIGLEKKLHRSFKLQLNDKIKSSTRTVVITPEYKPYDTLDWVLSMLALFSEIGYAFFTKYSASEFFMGLIHLFGGSEGLKNFLKGLSISSSAADSGGSWLMMANTREEINGAENAYKVLKADWRQKHWRYRLVMMLNGLIVFGTYLFGSVVPAIGFANDDRIKNSSHAGLLILTFGSFWFAGQMVIYIFTNIPGLTLLTKQLFNEPNSQREDESDWNRFWKLSLFKKILFILLTGCSGTNRGWGFFGSVKMLNDALIAYDVSHIYWGRDNPTWIFRLGVLAAVLSGIQTISNQSAKTLKMLAGKFNSPSEFHFKNKLLKYLCYFLFGSFMSWIWCSRAFSGPERLVTDPAEKYEWDDLPLAFVGLFMSMLGSAQFVLWVFPDALNGIHYLLNQFDFYRGTAYEELGGYDGVQYLKLTETDKQQLKEVPEEVVEEESLPAKNQGVIGFLRTALCCCFQKKPDNASINSEDQEVPKSQSQIEEKHEKKNDLGENEEEVNPTEKRCPSLWTAITTCCGLLNCFRKSEEDSVPQTGEYVSMHQTERDDTVSENGGSNAFPKAGSSSVWQRLTSGMFSSPSQYRVIGESEGCCSKIFSCGSST